MGPGSKLSPFHQAPSELKLLLCCSHACPCLWTHCSDLELTSSLVSELLLTWCSEGSAWSLLPALGLPCLAHLGGCGTGESPALLAGLVCSASSSPFLAESQLWLLPDRLFLSQSPQLLKTDDLSKSVNPFSFTEEQKWWIHAGIKPTTNDTEPWKEKMNSLTLFPLFQGQECWSGHFGRSSS